MKKIHRLYKKHDKALKIGKFELAKITLKQIRLLEDKLMKNYIPEYYEENEKNE